MQPLCQGSLFILGSVAVYLYQSNPEVAKAASSPEEQHHTASPSDPIPVHRSPWGEFVIPTQNTPLV